MEDQQRMPSRIEGPAPIDQVRRTSQEMVVLFLAAVAMGLLGLIGYGVYLMRAWLPYLGVAAFLACLAVIACVATWPIIWVVKAAKNLGHTHIGDNGTVINTLFGRRLYAPMTANAVKVSRVRNKVKIQQEVPTIKELIESGVITVGQMIMHMGFEVGKGGLIPVLDAWPGSFAIPGQGRSGKTRRATSIIFQAIIAGAKVIVCDPHDNKPDGIAKLLAPLDRWITIIRGEENCAAAAAAFLNEMERRVSDQEGGPWKPWFILIDEWSRLMIRLGDDDREMLIGLVRDCSTQYAGYNGYAGIIGHIWTEKESGGTVIRRTLHHAFVHRLNAEYARFFLSSKWARRAEELSMRECLYREGPVTRQIMTITVPDDSVEWFAGWLEEHMPQDMLGEDTTPFKVGNGAPGYTPMIEAPKEPQQHTTGPLVNPDQLPKYMVTHSEGSRNPQKNTRVEHENISSGNPGTHWNPLDRPIDTAEPFPNLGGTVGTVGTSGTLENTYTDEEERLFVQALVEMSREGEKITMTGVRDFNHWNGHQYTKIIQPLWKKYALGNREGQ